jgi:hypothetical protein
MDRLTYEQVGDQGGDGGLRDVTLWAFVRLWSVSGETVRRRPRAAPRMVNLYPRYFYRPTHATYEDFCRAKMMLHHPWLTREDVAAMRASPTEGLEPTYAYAYQRCQLNSCYHARDPLDPLDGEENEDDIDAMTEYEEDGHADEDLGMQQGFTVLAGRTGLHDASNVGEVETTLGKRDIDLTYDWHGSDYQYNEYGHQSNFYTQAKTIEPNVDRILHDPDTLQGSQRTCFDLIMRQYELEVRGEGELP